MVKFLEHLRITMTRNISNRNTEGLFSTIIQSMPQQYFILKQQSFKVLCRYYSVISCPMKYYRDIRNGGGGWDMSTLGDGIENNIIPLGPVCFSVLTIFLQRSILYIYLFKENKVHSFPRYKKENTST